MADHHQRPWPTHTQVLGQPADHLDIEMVGGLVEHQHVVPGQQHLGQRHPAAFTTGQPANARVQVDACQQVFDHVAGIGLGRPHVVCPAVDDDVADGGTEKLVALP